MTTFRQPKQGVPGQLLPPRRREPGHLRCMLNMDIHGSLQPPKRSLPSMLFCRGSPQTGCGHAPNPKWGSLWSWMGWGCDLHTAAWPTESPHPPTAHQDDRLRGEGWGSLPSSAPIPPVSALAYTTQATSLCWCDEGNHQPWHGDHGSPVQSGGEERGLGSTLQPPNNNSPPPTSLSWDNCSST